MDVSTQTHFENIYTTERQAQNDAYYALISATDEPVQWAYEVWDEMLKGLTDQDNHVRAITAQILCNLAKSDPEKRMLKDFPTLLNVTKDAKFVTARHCMQNLWKIGVVGQDQRAMLIEGLAGRYAVCITEKNCTLIRYDIIESLKNVYDRVPDEAIRDKALELIETEEDLKYRKKYAKVWK